MVGGWEKRTREEAREERDIPGVVDEEDNPEVRSRPLRSGHADTRTRRSAGRQGHRAHHLLGVEACAPQHLTKKTKFSSPPPRTFFFWLRPRLAGVACSRHSTQGNPSGSRFRAVHCYDDPTNDCGSGSATQWGLAESETRLCSGRLPRPCVHEAQ